MIARRGSWEDNPDPRVPAGSNLRLLHMGAAEPSIMSMLSHLRPATWVLAPALVFLSGCQSTETAQEDVRALIRATHYGEALELAIERVDEDPNSEQAQEDLARARAADYLSRARVALFDRRLDDALELLELASEQMPDSEVIRQWTAKAQQEKAAVIRVEAFELSAEGHYEASLDRYQDMLALLDGSAHPSSIARLRSESLREAYDAAAERLEVVKAFREESGAEYYREGVRALREYRTSEAVKAFQASLKYAPDVLSSQQRDIEVARIQGEDRLRIAEELEGEGFYRAAATEYRSALSFLPENTLAAAGLERMEREVTVLNDLREVDRLMRRGDFELCFSILEEAAKRTQLLSDDVQIANELALEARVEDLYETALEYERDFRYLPAIDAFDALLEEADGFYKDAISRRDTLSDYVADATELYARSKNAADEAELILLLSQIELIWPTFKDVEAQLEELRGEDDLRP